MGCELRCWAGIGKAPGAKSWGRWARKLVEGGEAGAA